MGDQARPHADTQWRVAAKCATSVSRTACLEPGARQGIRAVLPARDDFDRFLAEVGPVARACQPTGGEIRQVLSFGRPDGDPRFPDIALRRAGRPLPAVYRWTTPGHPAP